MVQVRIRMVGLCGTDVHLWQEGPATDYFKLPMILGHECSGVVSKLGEKVTRLKVGNRVAVEPMRPCRNCEFCYRGHYNMCPDHPVLFAPPPHNGALCQYLIQDENFVYKLPDKVSFEEGALVEPLSVSLRACSRANITLGDNVLICGAGSIGLCVLLAAKTSGASKIIITDVNSSRLSLAKELGATHTLRVVPGENPEDTAKKIRETIGCDPDRAMECSGTQGAISVCIHSLKPCGSLVFVGIGSQSHMNIPIREAIVKEINMTGSICFVRNFSTAIEMIANGRIAVAQLATHTFPLKETLQALEVASSGNGMKIMIECNPE